MVSDKLFGAIYHRRRVLVTGHTGFKGSWLVYWLQHLGAQVAGYSDKVPTNPSHFELLDFEIESYIGDVRNREYLFHVVQEFQPEIIFHLAAQPLVRYSYEHPLETFETNIIGTANVFDAARFCSSVRAIVNVTSDKAYENLEIDVAYKETDRMGGYDPYSASKGCAELVVNSYRNSYFNVRNYKLTHHILLASVRAGNVIGGGDWAADRLIPDIIRASVNKCPLTIRNPKATRPWQHVLEPISGYLLIGQLLLEEKPEFADGWNFGPLRNEALAVEDVLQYIKSEWPELRYNIETYSEQPHEAKLLRLDCTKANQKLNWFPVWEMDKAIQKTGHWYKEFYDTNQVLTLKDLNDYIKDAKAKKISWTHQEQKQLVEQKQ